MSNEIDNINGIYAADANLRSGINTLRSGVLNRTIQPLTATESGVYTADPSSGVYGYSPVTVQVSGGGSSTQLPSGYTAIDYVECPSSGQAGFVVTGYDLVAFDIIETLTMPYYIPSNTDAAFAGIEDIVEFYYYNEMALTWVDGADQNLFGYRELPDAQAYEQYYHKDMIYDNYTDDFTIGYYKIGEFPFAGRIYKFKIHRTSELDSDIRVAYDFRPCIRDSDDKVGMYDVINDVFYYSTTGTDFVAPSA